MVKDATEAKIIQDHNKNVKKTPQGRVTLSQ